MDTPMTRRCAILGNLQLNNGDTMREMALAGAGIARLAFFSRRPGATQRSCESCPRSRRALDRRQNLRCTKKL
jgi:DNA-binding transcriptional LysR family regulator